MSNPSVVDAGARIGVSPGQTATIEVQVANTVQRKAAYIKQVMRW